MSGDHECVTGVFSWCMSVAFRHFLLIIAINSSFLILFYISFLRLFVFWGKNVIVFTLVPLIKLVHELGFDSMASHLSFIQTRQYNNNHLSHKFWIREIIFFFKTVALSFNGLCCEITENIPLCRSFDIKRWFFGHHLCIDLIEYQI